MTKSYLAIFMIYLAFASCNNPITNASDQLKVETEALLENESEFEPETESKLELETDTLTQSPEFQLTYPEFITTMS